MGAGKEFEHYQAGYLHRMSHSRTHSEGTFQQAYSTRENFDPAILSNTRIGYDYCWMGTLWLLIQRFLVIQAKTGAPLALEKIQSMLQNINPPTTSKSLPVLEKIDRIQAETKATCENRSKLPQSHSNFLRTGQSTR